MATTGDALGCPPIATGSSSTLGGNAVYFSESGVGNDPGRVCRLDDLGNDGLVSGHVVVEGDWGRLGRPDNLRFTDAGDNKLLYLSIQADPPRRSHIIAIRHPGGGFNQPYDR